MTTPSTTDPTQPVPEPAASLIERIPYTPRARILQVARVTELSPTMRRVVLTGPDLEPELPFHRLATAAHVKLCPPDPRTGEVRLPQPGAPRGAADAPALRSYTIRAVDHDRRELTIDLVLHAHGPVGRWAIAAAPGDQIGVLGPRGSQVYPSTFAEYLLVADETGTPAIERFLEELPTQATAHVVVLLGPDAAPRDLGGRHAADIGWLRVEDVAAAGDAVVAAVADLPVTDRTFAWGAGEAGVMRELRRHLRLTRAMPAEHVVVRGYWRLGTAGEPPKDYDVL
ncbi:MAG: siderophore-interacting protein [Cellulomonadaceae bacterium]|nr:siderophore-interacting protein [Cellulomonadaceae bacterium]